MTNVNAKRDDNRVTTLLALDDLSPEFVELWNVDPITDRLLIDITLVPDQAPPTLPATFPRDDNYVTVMGLETDDANKIPTPLLIHHQTGLPFIDLLQE